MMYILYDVGATKMRVAATQSGDSFTTPIIEKTPKDFDEGVRVFCDSARRAAAQVDAAAPIAAIVGGMAGTMDKETGVMHKSPHLPDWNGRPFKERIEAELQTKLVIENDADIVGLGEAVYGAGRHADISAYITVSTGVGGGRFVDGKIDRHRYGFEPGLHIVDIDGSVWPEINPKGTLEGLISGTALSQKYHREPVEVSDPEVWTELAKRLAVGVHNTMLHWSPDVTVLGGSMITGDPCITYDVMRSHLEEIMTQFSEVPATAKAELGDIGGLYGAMAYVNRQLE